MIDELNVCLFFPKNTSNANELSFVLGALEAEPLAVPTHASLDERKRLPYDRDAAVKSVAGKRIAGLKLWRGKTPKYSRAYASANNKTHNHVSADYASGLRDSHLPQLFATWTRLSDVLKPEFGFVHCLWALGKESEEYNRGVRINFKKLRDAGFRSLHARTWFGQDLVSVIGKERLLSLPHTQATSWGGVQLDLVENPWLADFQTLRNRQEELLRIFASWGLVGDYTDLNNTVPGRFWTPRLWDL